jgi:hypothetical protein
VEGRAKQVATGIVIVRYPETRVKPTKSAQMVVNRHPPDAGLALERRMREADVGSQCAGTIKLNFRFRCGQETGGDGFESLASI